MPPRKDQLDGLAVTLLIGCCLFWGFQQVLVKVTIAEVAPVFQAAIRFLIATGLVIAWSWWRGLKLFEADQSLFPGILAGILFAIEFAGIYIGLEHTSVARLTIFLYTAPFWVAVILPATTLGESLNREQWIGLSIAFAGVILAFSDGLMEAGKSSNWFGDAMGIVAGAAWGLTTVIIRKANLTRISPEKLLLYQVAISALALPFLSLALGEQWSTTFSGFALLSLSVQALVGAFATYLIWMWMIGRYPATRMSSFTFLAPVFALGFGFLLLGEPVSGSTVFALACVASGIFLVNWRDASRKKKPVVFEG